MGGLARPVLGGRRASLVVPGGQRDNCCHAGRPERPSRILLSVSERARGPRARCVSARRRRLTPAPAPAMDSSLFRGSGLDDATTSLKLWSTTTASRTGATGGRRTSGRSTPGLTMWCVCATPSASSSRSCSAAPSEARSPSATARHPDHPDPRRCPGWHVGASISTSSRRAVAIEPVLSPPLL